MGFDQRFTLVLIGWIAALLAALSALAFAIATPDLAAARIVAGALVAGAGYGLARHVDRTNRTVGRFIEALNFGDFAMRFDRSGGAGFAALGQSLDDAMRRLQANRDRSADEQRFLETLVDDMPVALLTIDHQNSVRLANKAARRLFTAHAGARPADFAVYGETFAARLAEDGERPAELLLLRSTAGPQRAIVRIATLERLGLTSRVVTVEPVQGTLDAIEMAAQTDLVRVLTHEILNSLTPVTSLASSAAAVLDDDPPDLALARTAVGTLARRAEGLEKFVRSYRSVANVPDVRRQKFGAEPFLRDLHRLFVVDWPDLRLDIAVEPGLTIEADPDLLAQAVINLLRNAAQATREAARDQSIALTATGDNSVVRRLTVTDSGKGIPDAERRDIFLPFYTTRAQGTGVGLNLVRQIVIAHGWTIDVGEAPGGGAEFRLYLG
ncbi:MAG: sensor histidine kinase [Proteobacteria bacterium]|nr:sensor histidine kinase [Pseudomonadota bacterium]